MSETSYEGSSSVTPCDGKYCWSYEMNRLRNIYPLFGMLKISGWFGVAGLLAVRFMQGWDSGTSMVLPLVCGFAITAIPAVFWLLSIWIIGKRAFFRYEMDADKVSRLREKKKTESIEFSAVRSGKVWERYNVIELHSLPNTMPVYVPAADFDFVKGFILDHVPADTDLRDMD